MSRPFEFGVACQRAEAQRLAIDGIRIPERLHVEKLVPLRAGGVVFFLYAMRMSMNWICAELLRIKASAQQTIATMAEVADEHRAVAKSLHNPALMAKLLDLDNGVEQRMKSATAAAEEMTDHVAAHIPRRANRRAARTCQGRRAAR